ncbi:gas vesicle protein [Streptomyces sp. NPDC054887]
MTEPATGNLGSFESRATPAPYGQGTSANLADILERVLDKGIVIAGDIQINLLDIELLTVKLRLLVVSVDKAKEMGIDWWEHDPSLSSRAEGGARDLAEENRLLREEIAALRDARELPPADRRPVERTVRRRPAERARERAPERRRPVERAGEAAPERATERRPERTPEGAPERTPERPRRKAAGSEPARPAEKRPPRTER